jgi:uncharacterized membrane protein (DUF373 family)
MPLKADVAAERARWRLLTIYEKFEHVVLVILTAVIAVVIVAAVFHLAFRVLFGLVLSGTFDPVDPSAFQAVFGMIFIVIIALEFKRSLLVAAERHRSIVQVRTVILLAMLAMVRKLIILDLGTTDAQHLFAVAAAILALGLVHWLVRDQDRRDLP